MRYDRMPKLLRSLLGFILKKGKKKKLTLSLAPKCKSGTKIAATDDDTKRRAFVEERRKRAAMHKRTRYEFELKRSFGSIFPSKCKRCFIHGMSLISECNIYTRRWYILAWIHFCNPISSFFILNYLKICAFCCISARVWNAIHHIFIYWRV